MTPKKMTAMNTGVVTREMREESCIQRDRTGPRRSGATNAPSRSATETAAITVAAAEWSRHQSSPASAPNAPPRTTPNFRPSFASMTPSKCSFIRNCAEGTMSRSKGAPGWSHT